MLYLRFSPLFITKPLLIFAVKRNKNRIIGGNDDNKEGLGDKRHVLSWANLID